MRGVTQVFGPEFGDERYQEAGPKGPSFLDADRQLALEYSEEFNVKNVPIDPADPKNTGSISGS